jgi:minor extracellular serine protease Vpr
MRTRMSGPSLAAILFVLVSGGSNGAERTAIQPTPAGVETDYVIVTFESPPAASYAGGIPGLPRTAPAPGQKLDTLSGAYRAYQGHLQNAHAAFRAYLQSRSSPAQQVREYFAVLNGVAVRLNGTPLAVLLNGPGVQTVQAATVYRPTMNISTALIRASEVWGTLGGQAGSGSGIRVAVIDSGIDPSNPFFDDTGLAPQAQIDACDDQDNDPATPDTNNKVVVCKQFFTGDTPASAGVPELCDAHGTHVAGTIGGRAGTSGTVARTDVVLTGLSGVAPGVVLGNYNAFPCAGIIFTAFGDVGALTHDLTAAIEEAVLDGMDVISMSLGFNEVNGPRDLLAEAANAAVDAGAVVVVAAGNAGPGEATVGTPASAAKVITAGASANPHYVGITVHITGGPAAGTSTAAAIGDFATFTPALAAAYTTTTPADACAAISSDVTGKVALIDRGVCNFTTKIRNAEAAGAVGVLVVNNVAGDPSAMTYDGTVPFPTIPAAMVARASGAAMKPGGAVIVDGTAQQEIVTASADIIAAFSSRGPTPFTELIKPDLTAPGVNVVSGVFGGVFAFVSGTSMAAPHVSGVAALLLARYPEASPAEVKSRMVNNAARVVTDHINGTVDPGVLVRGGGRVDVAEAFEATTWFDPVSVSFGLVRRNERSAKTRIVTVNGASAISATVQFAATPPQGLTISVTTDGPQVVVMLSFNSAVPIGDYSGDIAVTGSDGRTCLVPFWARVVDR